MLQWWVMSDYTKYEVVPIDVVSPLRMRVMQQDPEKYKYGMRLLQKGDPVSIMDFHIGRGFFGIPEATLERLCVAFGIEGAPSPALLKGNSATLSRSAALLRHLRPDMEEQGCERALLKKRFGEMPEDIGELRELIDEDVLYSVLLADDIGAFKQWTGECERNKTQLLKDGKSAKAVTVAVYHAIGGPSSRKPKPRGKAGATVKAKAKPHWHPQILAREVWVLHELKPGPAAIFVAEYNGAFRLIYDGVRRKSISWTLRGRPEAVCLVLKHAWRLHGEASGESCPWPDLISGSA